MDIGSAKRDIRHKLADMGIGMSYQPIDHGSTNRESVWSVTPHNAKDQYTTTYTKGCAYRNESGAIPPTIDEVMRYIVLDAQSSNGGSESLRAMIRMDIDIDAVSELFQDY